MPDDHPPQNVRGKPDVSALASLDKNKLAVLVWHYHDDDVPGPDAAVDLTLDGLPVANGTATLTQYIIDADHSNSYEAWKRMGSPMQPTPEQYAQLEKAGQARQTWRAGKNPSGKWQGGRAFEAAATGGVAAGG